MTVPIPPKAPTRPVSPPVSLPRRAPGGGTAYVRPVLEAEEPLEPTRTGREALAVELRDFISGAQPMGLVDTLQLLSMIEQAGWTPPAEES